MDAFGYLRVSGKGQIDKDGFDRQRDVISKFATQSNINVTRYYSEKGVSGTKGENDRPALQEMVTDILSNGVNTIIVERLDRLAREYVVQEQLLIYLASKGIVLFNASTGENITEAIHSDPMKKAIIQIQGVFSELEKSLLVKRLKKARQRKRIETGKCEGTKGWDEIDPERKVEVLKLIRRLRRKPKGRGRQKSYQDISDHLNTEGIKTLRGGRWSPQLVRAFHKGQTTVAPQRNRETTNKELLQRFESHAPMMVYPFGIEDAIGPRVIAEGFIYPEGVFFLDSGWNTLTGGYHSSHTGHFVEGKIEGPFPGSEETLYWKVGQYAIIQEIPDGDYRLSFEHELAMARENQTVVERFKGDDNKNRVRAKTCADEFVREFRESHQRRGE